MTAKTTRPTDDAGTDSEAGVSFVIPVHDGRLHLEAVLRAVLAQDTCRPTEVIAVDDGSTDGSDEILSRFAGEHGARVVSGTRRGAAAALNLGLRAARHPLIAQVDQDVVVEAGWLERLAAAFADPAVAAAQGHYMAAPGASLWARVMALDLAQRYRRLPRHVDHVCTGNTLYRASALAEVGGFDEELGYAYDNDLSYRLGEAGYRLVLCHDARSVHYWRESVRGYLRQQYGQGYGRLDLLARHRGRFSGDDVSGPGMMLHAQVMTLAAASLAAAPLLAWAGGPWRPAVLVSAILVGALFAERSAAGLAAFAASGDRAALAFGPAHLLRDLAWVAAIARWTLRRLLRRPARASHSMSR